MPETPPHILLVTTDQQRHDTVGPEAPDFMHTPHCDWLARQGTRFTSAYADCPVCVPSRVTIMTGKSAMAHGLPRNGSSSSVMGEAETLPSHLRALGYHTAAIGKMHFSPQRRRHGFEEMVLPDDYYREMTRSGEIQQPMRHGLGQNELHPGMATVPESRTLTAWTADRCLDYIDHRRDPTKPFFLWCSFSKPHPPLDPPEPYFSLYRDEPIPDPVAGDWAAPERCPPAFERWRQCRGYDRLTKRQWRAARAAYYGLITQIDYNLGRVFAALGAAGVLENTLILYASDHGEYLGDHHAGAKGFFHEPSAHVPFLLRLPPSWESGAAGTTCAMPVTLADILPTCVGAAGGTPPPDAEGRDLSAVARGTVPADRRHVTGMFRVSCETADHLSITDGRWKYMAYPEGAHEQLFDLRADPREERDLSASPDHDATRRAMREALVERLRERRPELVADGDIVSEPPQNRDERAVRAGGGPGFLLEHANADTRH